MYWTQSAFGRFSRRYNLGCDRCGRRAGRRRRRLQGLGVSVEPIYRPIISPARFSPIAPEPVVSTPGGPLPTPPVYGYPWNPLAPGYPIVGGTGTVLPTSANPVQQSAVNPPGGPASTVQNYDPAGNPIYAVPPPGQVITGYDSYGTPLYGTAPPGGAIVTYDALGNPVYATPPAGTTVVGYDSLGNPIYSGASPGQGITPTSAAPVSVSVQAPAAAAGSSDYQAVLDWLTQQSLISGVPNWGVAAGALVAFMLLKGKLERGR